MTTHTTPTPSATAGHTVALSVDEARALALYRQAADHELPEAVQALAIAYRNGELGLPRDADAFHAQWIEAAHALKPPALAP